MNFLKKWMTTIISFVAGVCGLALSATVGMKAVGMIDASALEPQLHGDYSQGFKETTKAFRVLTDSDLYKNAKSAGIGSEFMVMKVFAIITLIISLLLIAYAIVMLLKNLNVIKCESKIFNIVGISLLVLLAVATIGLLVSSYGYANAIEESNMAIIQARNEFEAGLRAEMPEAMHSMIPTLLQGVKITASASIGFYQPAMLVISIVSALAVGAVTFLNRKDA